jgi:hypothetical protein
MDSNAGALEPENAGALEPENAGVLEPEITRERWNQKNAVIMFREDGRKIVAGII